MKQAPLSLWKWAALSAAAMALLALYPQINLLLGRGGHWQGSYVLVQGDEDAYSAYLNALIDGRPRRNDPHTGRDDLPEAPQPESLFSIQFIPAYVLALPAQVLHFSASTMFLLLIAVAAIATSLAIFWLLWSVIEDPRLAAAGVLFVLCLGTLVATQGEARAFLGNAPMYSFFPFLRRYQPALPFPLFFVFCLVVWRAIKTETLRTAIGWSVAAGTLIAVLIFSYFYLWTAALAWIAGCTLIFLIWQQRELRRWLIICGIVFGSAAIALVPYFMLLRHRDPNMDKVQLLTLTHAPDLLRVCEVLGIASLIGLFAGLRRGLIISDKQTLFIASLALMPLVVFNQQVLTGRSLQPLHYELFIANYVSLMALIMTAGVLFQRSGEAAQKIPGRAIALVALAAFGWGIIESTGATRRDIKQAQIREDAMPVGAKLRELARTDGTLGPHHAGPNPRPVVFSSTLPLADCLPTVSGQASLWALHMDAFPGASQAERKERFYQYMYYSGIGDKELEKAILEGRFAIMSALFGVERVIPGLVPGEKPLTLDDMRMEWLGYSQYISNFSRERASKPSLSYVVVPTEAMPDLSNLDRWYERGAGIQAGLFTIYPVTLRP